MKWAWVPREHYDIVHRLLERQYTVQSALLEAERERYADLLARYHDLRLQGYNEPPAPVVVERQKPDPLKQAIAAKCGNNRQLRENMERQAAYDRQAGMSDAEIVLKINAGVSPEETFAVAGL